MRTRNPVAFALGALTMLFGATSSSSEELSYRLQLSPNDVHIVDTEMGKRVAVTGNAADRYTALEDEGYPALPYRVVTVLLPQGHRVSSFRVSPSDRTILSVDLELPLEPRPISDDGTPGQSASIATGSGVMFPDTDARFLGEGTLHGYAVASFAIYPLRMRSDNLELASDMTLSVSTEPETRPTVARERFRSGFRDAVARSLDSMVINPLDRYGYSFPETVVPDRKGGFQPTTFPSLEGSPVDYVIITNDSLATMFQVLADFKTDKGVPTVVRTTEWILANYRNGSDPQETIRNFVIDAYEKWGITYVLLGGDTEQIPARLAWSSVYDGGRFLPVDMYYGCLDGDWNANHNSVFGEGGIIDNADLFAEVYVGRMPAVNNLSALTLVDKIVRYETPNDPTYTNRILLLAEVLFPTDWDSPGGGPITLNGGDLSDYIWLMTMQDPGLEVVRMYETPLFYPGSIQESYAAAVDSINTGFNLCNHIGHGFRFNMSVGDASIQNADADVFVNGDRLTNFYLLNCTAVAYTYFCLAEHLLQNPNGGAVSALGANESAFPNASQHYMNEYYELLMNEGVVHLGELFARSRLGRTPLAMLGDNIDLWTHYIYTCLGDPEMPLWTNAVDTLAVAHADTVGLGTTPITVTVLVGGSPVDSATVCLSKGNDDYQVGTTDGAGQVTMNFRAESAGAVKVVVTGRNHMRQESSIVVAEAVGAYVALDGYLIDDDSTGVSAGNGDGVVDAGETVGILFSVRNTGTIASDTVDIVLRTNDLGVAILDSTAYVGVVDSDATVFAADSMLVSFASSLGDEAVITFDVVIKEGGVETWIDQTKKLVHAPDLSKVTLRIDDTATGNGDGVVDPNEEFRLYYGLKNFGTGEAPPATAILGDVDNGFVFTDSTDTYAALASIAEGENENGFLIREPNTGTGHRLALTVTDTYGRVYADTFELRPPAPPSNIAINPGLGIDRLQLSWDAGASGDVSHYVVYSSLTSGGPYTRTTVDPVSHTVYLHTGLASSTKYYYYVTAVDISGNESAASPEKGGSTNPSQIGGWPIAMAVETVSSPVIGDIDGDGDEEIVVGDNLVYAWHHDGVELIDGDLDPQTWGVLSPLGDSYVGHVALARIDNQPGFDIIAASRVTKEVYVFDYTGTPVPGWPQPVENTIRAGVAVGDLNGDGLLEIVACDEAGVLYAWDNNGAEFVDGDADTSSTGVLYRLPGCNFQYSTPAVADIDGDGMDEVIIGTQGDEIYVINEDGSVSPNWPFALGSDISGSVAIGDVDNDGDLEIVAQSCLGNVYALNHDASQLYFQWFPNGGCTIFFLSSPALGDITGDGHLEAFFPSTNGNLYAVKSNGGVLAGWPVQYSATTTTESSPIVVDIDGNGALDVILGDETGVINGWDAAGSVLDGFPLGMADAARATCAASDPDRDGDIDLVAAGWDKNVYVWDFDGMYDATDPAWWSFHANVHNNGYALANIPTGIMTPSFSFRAFSSGVELLWRMPAENGFFFSIARAGVGGGATGEFHRIADRVTAGPDGMVRYVDAGAEPGEYYIYRIESADDSDRAFTTITVYVPVTRADLSQNYPNPFNPTTTIEYLVPDGPARPTSLVVYNVRGARVRTLVNNAVNGGRHRVQWDGLNDGGSRVSSGVYFYRLVQPGYTATKKMLLMK